MDKPQHILAGTLHLLSALTILVAALHESNGKLSKYDVPIKRSDKYNHWRYVCNPSGGYDCPDNEKVYYLPDAGDTGQTVPLIPLAFTFAFWSGVCHFLVVFLIDKKVALSSLGGAIGIRTIDYMISAPIMIAVINVLFGSSTYVGVILSPLFQFAVILLGGYVEFNSSKRPTKKVNTKEKWLLGCAVALYLGAWTPAFVAFGKARKGGGAPNVAKPPPLVWIALVTMFAVFSSFAVIFFVFLKKKTTASKEWWFTSVSLIAKLVLHAFIGIAIFGQENMVHHGDMSDDMQVQPNADGNQQQTALAAAGGIVVGVFLLNLGIKLC
jgi:lysylphosphatidylglycerol synthetase-like protein (DUF2156 family)